jgi:hypothetical protein
MERTGTSRSCLRRPPIKRCSGSWSLAAAPVAWLAAGSEIVAPARQAAVPDNGQWIPMRPTRRARSPRSRRLARPRPGPCSARQERGLKHRAAHETRTIPIPPSRPGRPAGAARRSRNNWAIGSSGSAGRSGTPGPAAAPRLLPASMPGVPGPSPSGAAQPAAGAAQFAAGHGDQRVFTLAAYRQTRRTPPLLLHAGHSRLARP